MKISSFMDSVKSPELAKRFSNKVPATVNEMMERLDDFVRSKETYASTELPKGETRETHDKMSISFNRRDNRSFRNTHPVESRRAAPVLTLDSLTKHPKEILAMKTQLRLPAPRPMLKSVKLRKQLEMPLESGKLNHLVKDVRQRGRGSHGRDAPQPEKIINVISVNSVKDKKRKAREITKSWMNIPTSFPAISSEDVSEEPLIVEAEVEGYL
ncbi:hypothetical protein Tco_0143028, partial [Tanacetum coccineum]